MLDVELSILIYFVLCCIALERLCAVPILYLLCVGVAGASYDKSPSENIYTDGFEISLNFFAQRLI